VASFDPKALLVKSELQVHMTGTGACHREIFRLLKIWRSILQVSTMRGKQKLSQSDYILRCTRYFHNDAKCRQQSSTVENERCSINTSIRFLGTDVANFTRFGWFRGFVMARCGVRTS
jgi:hypothetical protein